MLVVLPKFIVLQNAGLDEHFVCTLNPENNLGDQM
jgi:hypothetical protein